MWKKGSALVPSWSAFAVTRVLEEHFAEIVDYGFTAQLEEVLDRISNGDANGTEMLADFYFGPIAEGARKDGLRDLVTHRLPEIDAAAINTFELGLDAYGTPVIAKPGRYGPYVQRGDDTASIPDNLPPADLSVDKALELLAMPKGGKPIGTDPETDLTVFVMNGRFGPYVQLGEIDEAPDGKPRRASLFKTMDPYEVTLETALQLLSFPKVLGTDPETGEEIRAQNGKFGPYLTKGEGEKPDSRSLESEEQLLTVTLADAIWLFSQPKRRGRSAPKPPIAELGPDPVTGRPMVVKDGRFGEYVTDGETNASLRVGDVAATLSPERAAELLQARREYLLENGGPAAKKAAKKATAKKAAAKAPAKRAAKKRTTKKATVKRRSPDPLTSRTVAKGASKTARDHAARSSDD